MVRRCQASCMMRVLHLTTALGAALSAAGCEHNLVQLRQGSVASSPHQTQQETIILAYSPEVGFVRGTPAVLAGLGSPLKPAAGPNRTVAACRDAVHREAVKLGARYVEAVSAGPEKTTNRGQLVGPVRIRLIYDKGLNVSEVRQAKVTCVMSPDGRVTSVKTV